LCFREIKAAAKRGDKDSARILAKEVVNARKSVAKIYTAKANLSSVEMHIKEQVIQSKSSVILEIHIK
jgi:charged multivesicular body protein 3